MEMIRSALFKKILEKNRETLNQAYHIRRYRNIRFDPQDFLGYVRDIIEPVVDKHASLGEEILTTIVLTMYNRLLDLCIGGFLGNTARYPYFESNFKALIAGYDYFFTKQADEFIVAVSNALINIGSTIEQKVNVWQEALSGFSTMQPTLDEFKKIGVVIAWIAGHTAYREAAYDVLKGLNPEYTSLLLGISGSKEALAGVIKKMEDFPWISPKALAEGKPLHLKPLIHTVGKFTGLSGTLIKPPTVTTSTDGLIISDGESRFVVSGDLYGQALVPFHENKIRSTKNDPEFSLSSEHVVTYKGKSFELPEEIQIPISSWGSTSHTLCFCSPMTHTVFVIGMGSH